MDMTESNMKKLLPRITRIEDKVMNTGPSLAGGRHNPTATLCLGCNTDLKQTASGSVAMAMVEYMCNYTVKLQLDTSIVFSALCASIKALQENPPQDIDDLNIGGPVAYVSASRPTTRDGLILLKEVGRSALNKPLPPELLLESRRLEALEHNTRVRFKFLNEPLVEVPDAEHALGSERNLRNLRFNVSNNKHKAKDPKEPSSKRQKVFNKEITQKVNEVSHFRFLTSDMDTKLD
ncbi:hypothetical protein B0H10DRAFT_1960523 [Mycena sp. CBHHK59/15]|nr:hypothetical protein B0H10DRAFT_1960523 [Mycena sp. CBHHK59/15]